MLRLLAVLVVALSGARAYASPVTFPLVVDYEMLGAAFDRQLGTAEGGDVLPGDASGCRSLVLHELQAGPAEGRVRLTAGGTGRAGLPIFGFCLLPISWQGYVETTGLPEVDERWQLRLRDVDSALLDRDRRRTLVAGRIWDLVKGRFQAQLEGFAFDLAPPIAELRTLLHEFAEPSQAATVASLLDGMRPAGVGVDDEGLKVWVTLDVPETPAPPAVAEAPLAPPDLQRWQARLESWDAFLVFVIKSVGVLDHDEEVRSDLLELLLASRYQLLAALAEPTPAGVDPARQLFLDTWEGLRQILRRVAAHGVLHDRALRYATFLAAGDALAALDAIGPSVGIEISTDGLRRLARVLEPSFDGDPVAYSEAPDAALQELFHFHDPGTPPAAIPPEPDAWWWPGPRAALADEAPPGDLPQVARRLDRWVPDDSALVEYRDLVGRLLDLTAQHASAANRLEQRFAGLFVHLTRAVAWQESCWRQFVRKGGQTTFLLSGSGDIGLMQVNRRVWRGFFDVKRLQWEIAYNAGAGAEILAQLLTRVGTREAAESLDNAARATYAAYNGGPGAFRRYRSTRVPRLIRAIDRAFWEKYQAMVAGNALDFVLCIEGWPPGSRARLSVAPAGSTPTRWVSSRSSRATSMICSRHAVIASRPRASFEWSPLEKPSSMAS